MSLAGRLSGRTERQQRCQRERRSLGSGPVTCVIKSPELGVTAALRTRFPSTRFTSVIKSFTAPWPPLARRPGRPNRQIHQHARLTSDRRAALSRRWTVQLYQTDKAVIFPSGVKQLHTPYSNKRLGVCVHARVRVWKQNKRMGVISQVCVFTGACVCVCVGGPCLKLKSLNS